MCMKIDINYMILLYVNLDCRCAILQLLPKDRSFIIVVIIITVVGSSFHSAGRNACCCCCQLLLVVIINLWRYFGAFIERWYEAKIYIKYIKVYIQIKKGRGSKLKRSSLILLFDKRKTSKETEMTTITLGTDTLPRMRNRGRSLTVYHQ